MFDASQSNSPVAPVEEGRALHFEVHAKARDYFVFELQNVLLTFLTFGIYSAWAKVKRRKYFAQRTELEGHAFDFCADPMVVFRSRLIVFAVLAASSLMELVDPSLQVFGMIATFVALPWAIASSVAFNARNTEYRGVSFRFSGPLKDAYKSTYGAYGLTIVTLGLGCLAGWRMMLNYLLNHLRFGGVPFRFEQRAKPYWVLGAGYLVVALGLTFLYVGGSIALKDELASEAGVLGNLLRGGAFVAAIAFLVGFVQGRVINLFYNGLSLGAHRFESKIRGFELGLVYLTNTFAILATFGLAAPWAIVRTYKYRMSKLSILARGPLMQGVQDESVDGKDETDTLGDAYLDLDVGGFDFGL